jgi:hypothetical protein
VDSNSPTTGVLTSIADAMCGKIGSAFAPGRALGPAPTNSARRLEGLFTRPLYSHQLIPKALTRTLRALEQGEPPRTRIWAIVRYRVRMRAN